jgi:hypothetical protein
MKSILIGILFLLSVFLIKAQKSNNFNLVFGFGASYFFNEKTLNRYIDNTKLAGLNYVIYNKNQSLSFNPGLVIQLNDYHARMSNKRLVHVRQDVLSLNLDVLMRLSKKSFFRCGLFFSGLYHSKVFITQDDYNSRAFYSYGSSELTKGYFPVTIQAGFTLGLCFPFKLFKRDQKFNIKFTQSVSPLVNSDYNLERVLVGEDVKVLTNKARATMLIFGFDFNFKNSKRKKDEPVEVVDP